MYCHFEHSEKSAEGVPNEVRDLVVIYYSARTRDF